MKGLIAVLAALLLLAIGSAPLLATSHLTTVIAFDPTRGELPEGIAIDGQGNIYVGMAGNGEIWRITPAGQAGIYARLPSPGEGFMTGLAFDRQGYLYVAMSSFNPATHGIWWVGSSGEMGLWVPMEPTALPNWLEFWGSTLLVSDSTGGRVWQIDPSGNLSLWVESDLLMGDPALSPIPIPIGANGMAIWGSTLYVANTNFGRIVGIPTRPDGSAGTPAVVVADGMLGGADGITFDDDGTLYVAVNGQDAIVAVSPNGDLTPLAWGYPLQNPASLAIVGEDLYITNFAIVKPPGTQEPGLLRLALPRPATPPLGAGKDK
jgi:sugar lactone lactonase YvrE